IFNTYFLSFGIYKEADFFNYWPEDIAHLALEGNRGFNGEYYNLSDANLKGEDVTVLHVGLQHELNEKWTVGGRLKFYSSNMDVTSTSNKGFVGSGAESNQIFNGDAVVHTSNNERLKEVYRYIRDALDEGVDPVSDAIELHKMAYKDGKFITGNIGAGIDIGFTYEPSENWSYSASILDLGFIYHNDGVRNYVVTGTYGFDDVNNNSSDPDDLFQVVKGDF